MPTDALLDVRIRVTRRGLQGFTLDVAFEAPPGVTILFGPSGAGKSTTLAAIAGILRPQSGRVALGGEVWFDADARIHRPIHERGIAFVFQSLALLPHMSALSNVEYGIDRKLSRSERQQRAFAMLERMQVVHVAERKPRTLSGGEAQRVALARAFAMSPKLVMLDEPFSAMDRDLRRNLAADVRSVIDEKAIPLIYVTHHRNEARALGDRVVLLSSGRVRATGTVEELLPKLEADEDRPSPGETLSDPIGGTPVPRLRPVG